METPTIERKTPWALYAGIAAVVLLIIFLFWRNSRNQKALKALQKKNAALVAALAPSGSPQPAPDPIPVAAPPVPDQPAPAAKSPVQVAEVEEDPAPAKEVPAASDNPVIPSSLNYRIQPLEGEYSFNAMSTKPNGRRVFCNLETIGMSDEKELVFRLMEGNTQIDTTARVWPVEGKEIGTILTALLKP